MDAASSIASTATFFVALPAAAAGVRAYRTFGGLREITCPETAQAALVRIHVARALASRACGGRETPLAACSRWPGRSGCAQACRSQLASGRGGRRAGPGPTLAVRA